jgi:hypothetical protein
MDRKERNTGPNANDRINKPSTTSAEGRGDREVDVAANLRERGEDPSPDDRDRGERSSKETAGADNADRG